MSALERATGNGSLAVVPPAQVEHSQPDPTGGRLVAWAESLGAAHRIATALAGTAFAPQHFRGKPDDAAAAILYGDEIGLTPTAALRSIFVISGTPGLYARSMHALVVSRGHEVWTEEESETRVTVIGVRRGSSHPEKSTWTLERARKAGYTNNAQYGKNPQNMLYARALGDVCRKVAPDVLAGLALTVEEIQLEEPAATTTVTRSAPTRVARKPRAAAPVPEEPGFDEPAPTPPPVAQQPPAPPQDDDAPPPEPGATASLKAVQRLAIAMERTLDITDRDERLNWISARLDREVVSSKDLTAGEVHRLIDEAERGPVEVEEPPAEPEGWGQ